MAPRLKPAVKPLTVTQARWARQRHGRPLRERGRSTTGHNHRWRSPGVGSKPVSRNPAAPPPPGGSKTAISRKRLFLKGLCGPRTERRPIRGIYPGASGPAAFPREIWPGGGMSVEAAAAPAQVAAMQAGEPVAQDDAESCPRHRGLVSKSAATLDVALGLRHRGGVSSGPGGCPHTSRRGASQTVAQPPSLVWSPAPRRGSAYGDVRKTVRNRSVAARVR